MLSTIFINMVYIPQFQFTEEVIDDLDNRALCYKERTHTLPIVPLSASQRLPNLQVRCLSAEIVTVVSALEQCLGVRGSMEQLKISIPLMKFSSTKLEFF